MLNPLGSKILFKQRKDSQRIILIYIVSLKLIKYNKDEQLHEHFLTKKHIDKPKDKIGSINT